MASKVTLRLMSDLSDLLGLVEAMLLLGTLDTSLAFGVVVVLVVLPEGSLGVFFPPQSSESDLTPFKGTAFFDEKDFDAGFKLSQNEPDTGGGLMLPEKKAVREDCGIAAAAAEISSSVSW